MLSVARSFFTFILVARIVRVRRMHKSRTKRLEVEWEGEVNVHARLTVSCTSRKMEEETVANAFRKPIGPSARAYRGEIAKERK